MSDEPPGPGDDPKKVIPLGRRRRRREIGPKGRARRSAAGKASTTKWTKETAPRKRPGPNLQTREVRAMAKRLVEDPAYLRGLATRLRAGRAAHMEPLLWHYAHGKPRETVQVEGVVQMQMSAAGEAFKAALAAVIVRQTTAVVPGADGRMVTTTGVVAGMLSTENPNPRALEERSDGQRTDE